MYPFPQSVHPAIRSHVDAQTAFMNALSQSMSGSVQQVYQLNMQLGQSLLEEVAGMARHMLSAGRPTDALSAAAAHVQPGTDRLRVYQQQLSQLAAAAQVDLSRVTEQHVQETSRTARALADDVTRATTEATDKHLRQQEEAVKHSRAAFTKEAEHGARTGARFQARPPGSPEGAGATPDGQAGPASFSANVKGSDTRSADKGPSSPR